MSPALRMVLAIVLALAGIAVFALSPIPASKTVIVNSIVNGATGGLLVGFGFALVRDRFKG